MSEEHKKKLALAREKARAAKQVKMKERQENRELEKQEKELLKKQKVNRVQKLKEEVERDVPSEGNPPPQRPAPTPPQQKSLTREDIQQAQMDAIMAYENVRKARKEEKKKAQLIEAQKMEMRRKIAQAQPQSYSYGAKDTNGRLVNRYDNCY
jgi:hypothetical protein